MADKRSIAVCRGMLRGVVASLTANGLTYHEATIALAGLLQEKLSVPEAREVPFSGALEYIMRGVLIALEDGTPLKRRDYVMRNITQGRNHLEHEANRLARLAQKVN